MFLWSSMYKSEMIIRYKASNITSAIIFLGAKLISTKWPKQVLSEADTNPVNHLQCSAYFL